MHGICKFNKIGEGIILKINGISAFSTKNTLNKTPNKQNSKTMVSQTSPMAQTGLNYGSYDLSFGKNFKQSSISNFEASKGDFTQSSDRIWDSAYRSAKVRNHALITGSHLLFAVLNDFNKYLTQLNEGTKSYSDLEQKGGYVTPFVIEQFIGEGGALNDPQAREKIKKIVEKYIVKLNQELKNPNIPKGGILGPRISSRLAAEINSVYSCTKEGLNYTFADSIFLAALGSSNDILVSKIMKDMVYELRKAVIVDDKPSKQKHHLQFYDDKADRLWRNLDLGNNVYITYEGENRESIPHLLSSFANLIKKPGQKYNNLNPQNTEIVIFNKGITFPALEQFAKEAKKQPDKTHIFVLDFFQLFKSELVRDELHGTYSAEFTRDEIKLLKNSNIPNVRLVLYSNKDNYYEHTKQGAFLKDTFSDYSTLSIPTINAQGAKDILASEKGVGYVQSLLNKRLSPEVIERAVEITSERDGYFPEKAMEYLNKLALYYVDKDEITLDDIYLYESEAGETKIADDSQNWVKIISNTGKNLDDIAGSPMTRAEAKSVVNSITSNKKGQIRGYVTYLDNGTSYGGGRRHVAECIAGEAQIPMITINAREFALKDIDALSQNSNLSELKIKKLIDTAKAQAEANKNKTAMIFIENFDNFASNPLAGISSIYEQKAFSQLLAEMDSLRRSKDINLVIIGSTNYPYALDENIMKPNRFLNKIVIYSPQDSKETEDVLRYYLDRSSLQVGKDENERNQIIESISKTARGASVVDLIYIIDKAEEVSRERGKSTIDKSDFTEAYLRVTTGRVSSRFSTPKDNEIVAKHECGHALNAQIMYDIAKKGGKQWHMPSPLDFIALDPRGDYGAVTYLGYPQNNEYSFERIFADLVCSFGGYSTEEHFYNMKGSGGIFQDMNSATMLAKNAVMHLGMGARTGRIPFAYDEFNMANMSESMKEKIEHDVQTMLINAEYVSDRIVSEYSDFVEQFAQKYTDAVGTGNCIISSDEFQRELEDWQNSQSPEKKQRLLALEDEILKVIEKTKKGTQIPY